MKRHHPWKLGTLAITTLLVASGWIGCGGDTGSTNSVTTSGSTSSGGGSGGAGGSSTCPTSQTLCDGACINVKTDATNCGSCGNACAQGEVCVDGACSLNCAGGSTKCGNACVDVKHDPTHCGSCSTVCASDEVCDNGTCGVTCSGGTTQCGNSCVDTQIDPSHCGACNNLCGFGEVCSQGKCGLLCTGNTVKCGGTCANITTDAKNCGSCFNVCGPDQVCSNGVCSLVCGGGTTKCGGTCVDTAKDSVNCGGCGNVCGPGLSCVNSVCTLICGAGTTKCDNACVNTQNDPAHCGGCNNPCPQGQVCQAGTCSLVCSGGATLCGASCVDTQNDPTHCGNCQTTCGPYPNATGVCIAAACASVCNQGKVDCNGMIADGCEVTPSADPVNCGFCGNVCPSGANAMGTCAAGACGLACNAGFGNCDGQAANGCETNTQTSVSHCGMCNNVCAVSANATPTCAGGTCSFSCSAGFGDCDMNPANGCEVNTQTSATHCGACGLACAAGLACINGACSNGQLPQLAGTHNADITRGSTHNAFFADPVTGKVYWGPGYSTNQLTEYPNMANFLANTNPTNYALPVARQGTYHVAINGILYYNNTNTMYRVNLATNAILTQVPLANAGHTNVSHYDWGGYTDIDFYVDAGNTLYVAYAPPGNGPVTNLSRLDPTTLNVMQTWNIPLVKTQIGFGFMVNGRYYVGENFNGTAIKGMFTLATSTYDAAYTNSLSPVANEYITHTVWDPGGKRLLESSNGHFLVYPNVQ